MYRYFLLFILPLVFSFFIVEVFKPKQITTKAESNNNQYQKMLLNLQRFDITLFLQRIQKLAFDNNMIIQSIKQDQNQINITISAEFSQWFHFLLEVEKNEKYAQINSLQANKNSVNIGFITGQKINQNIADIQTLNFLNPFYICSTNKKINLEAIIGSYVIIDSKVVRIGEKYEDYILYSIQKDHIILQNSNEQITVRLKNV